MKNEDLLDRSLRKSRKMASRALVAGFSLIPGIAYNADKPVLNVVPENVTEMFAGIDYDICITFDGGQIPGEVWRVGWDMEIPNRDSGGFNLEDKALPAAENDFFRGKWTGEYNMFTENHANPIPGTDFFSSYRLVDVNEGLTGQEHGTGELGSYRIRANNSEDKIHQFLVSEVLIKDTWGNRYEVSRGNLEVSSPEIMIRKNIPGFEEYIESFRNLINKPAEMGPNDDPDGDGFPNLLEMALMQRPDKPDSLDIDIYREPFGSIIASIGYRTPLNLRDLSQEVISQASYNLESWFDSDYVREDELYYNSQYQKAIFRLGSDLPERVFFRLRVVPIESSSSE